MQVVKKVLILIVFIGIFQSCFSQKKLAGNYIRKDIALMVKDIGSSYSFNRYNSFTQTDFLHLESQLILKGNYKLKKDTLTLYYIPNIKKEKDYKFIKKKKVEKNNYKDYLFSKIKLTNKGLRKADVELLIYDKKGKLLMGFSSNENGEFPYLSLFDTKIGYFIFSSLLYQEVKIPSSELFGFSSEVHIKLKKNLIEYSQKKDTINYLIKSFTKKKIELENIKTKEKVILLKQ